MKISRELFDAVIAKVSSELGLKVSENAAWTKIQGPNGQRVYVAKGKSVGRVDLSGFGKGLDGTTSIKSPNGKVEAHLDMMADKPLDNFEALLRMLPSLPAPVVKAKPEPKVKVVKAKPATETPPTEEDLAARKAKIAEAIARRKAAKVESAEQPTA